jgi:hypothetical protein
MAFRKASLDAIGGFDPRFRVAGDDVDICWRLQDQGWTVGFSAGAAVWHHRRDKVRRYLKQQFEYGKAEALLERKWPERYNRVGHLAWEGRVYANGSSKALVGRRWKIYYGRWGTGLFQSVYTRTPGALASLPLVPEWYLVLAALTLLSALGALWTPLLLALPLLALATGALAMESAFGAARAYFPNAPEARSARMRMRVLTALLYMLQPLARLSGRLRHGLAPWRRRSAALALPLPRTTTAWNERWQSADERLRAIEAQLRRESCAVLQGSEYDRWDLQVRGGIMGAARMRMAVEEHGAGRQLVRLRMWPRYSRVGLALIASFAGLAVGAGLAGAWVASGILGVIAVALAASAVRDTATAVGVLAGALDARHGSGEVEAAGAPEGGLQETASWVDTEVAMSALGNENGHEPRSGSARLGELPSSPQMIPSSSKNE